MKLPGIDRQLVLVITLLCLFGLAALYSAGQTDIPSDAAGVWRRQLFWLGLGLIAAWGVSHLSFRLLEWMAPALYGTGVALLVLVLAVGTGAGTAASSHSWLRIGSHQIGQPSEFAKVATVIMLARYLSSRREPPRGLGDLLVPGMIVGVPFLLVLKQPDLGSAIVFLGICFAMLFWAGVRPRLLFMLASPVLSVLLAFSNIAWAAWMIAFTALILLWRPYLADGLVFWLANVVAGAVALPLWKRLAVYQQKRLLTFLNPEIDPVGAGYHAIQSRVAIGSGGWLGAGYTHGPQKRLAFLPEQHTDFIFAVVGEELGFVGVCLALFLFLALFIILVRIARRAPDAFSSLVVFGIAGLLFTHVFENVGMTVNLMPITGIPLPFFSYGGSFFVICMICMGLVARVAWDARQSGYHDV